MPVPQVRFQYYPCLNVTWILMTINCRKLKMTVTASILMRWYSMSCYHMRRMVLTQVNSSRKNPLLMKSCTQEHPSPNLKWFQCSLLGLRCIQELVKQLLTGFCVYCTHILPIGNILPICDGEVKSVLHNFLTPTKEYHCCINDCVVFRDRFSKIICWFTIPNMWWTSLQQWKW